MKVIELTKGQVAIVDDEDFDNLAQYRWHFQSSGYAARCKRYCPRKENKHHTVLMHREIMLTPVGMDTDHLNGNKLDNRRCNLRIATQSQNRCNTGCQKDNPLGLKGVSKVLRDGRYSAVIQFQGKRKYLGSYLTPQEAKAAYDLAAIDIHKEFARLN